MNISTRPDRNAVSGPSRAATDVEVEAIKVPVVSCKTAFSCLDRVCGIDGKRRGLGVAGVAMLKAVRDAALRLSESQLRQSDVIGSWDKLIDYCKANIAHGTVEEFHLLFLNRKNELIKHERQQRGTIDHTPVYPREVVKRALELDASALILVHNHPSGDPTPSKADIAVTRDIINAAKPLGVTVHEHLIIGRGRHTSLRDLGLL